MRSSSLTIPETLEAAVGVCRRRFGLAAGLSALPTFQCLGSWIATVQVYDQVHLKYGTQTMKAQVSELGMDP